jgi:glycerophosphoryl diester phosphodiesterase
MHGLRLRFLIILLCLPLVASLHALGQYDPSQILNAWQTRQPGLTLVGSHRGEVNGAFGNNMPENSLNALQNAVDAGNEIVEMDIYTTQDHVPYLMHDKTLFRMMGFNQPSAYNPDPNRNPAAEWSAIQGFHLCGSRGITDPASGGTGQCQTNYSPIENVPSLVDLANAVRTAQNLQGQTWGASSF